MTSMNGGGLNTAMPGTALVDSYQGVVTVQVSILNSHEDKMALHPLRDSKTQSCVIRKGDHLMSYGHLRLVPGHGGMRVVKSRLVNGKLEVFAQTNRADGLAMYCYQGFSMSDYNPATAGNSLITMGKRGYGPVRYNNNNTNARVNAKFLVMPAHFAQSYHENGGNRPDFDRPITPLIDDILNDSVSGSNNYGLDELVGAMDDMSKAIVAAGEEKGAPSSSSSSISGAPVQPPSRTQKVLTKLNTAWEAIEKSNSLKEVSINLKEFGIDRSVYPKFKAWKPNADLVYSQQRAEIAATCRGTAKATILGSTTDFSKSPVFELLNSGDINSKVVSAEEFRAVVTDSYSDWLRVFCNAGSFMIDGQDVEYILFHKLMTLAMHFWCMEVHRLQSNAGQEFLSGIERASIIMDIDSKYTLFFGKRRHLVIAPFFGGTLLSAQDSSGMANAYMDAGHTY